MIFVLLPRKKLHAHWVNQDKPTWCICFWKRPLLPLQQQQPAAIAHNHGLLWQKAVLFYLTWRGCHILTHSCNTLLPESSAYKQHWAFYQPKKLPLSPGRLSSAEEEIFSGHLLRAGKLLSQMWMYLDPTPVIGTCLCRWVRGQALGKCTSDLHPPIHYLTCVVVGIHPHPSGHQFIIQSHI